MVFFTTCRKDINEPPIKTKNQNFVYLDIDGEKFMIEDRNWNLNKHTRGNFEIDGSLIKVRYRNDTIIEIGFNAQNTAKENKSEFRILRIGMNLEMTKKLGTTRVRQIGLTSKCYTDNDSIYYSYSINKYELGNGSPAIENTSFKNCNFTIVDYDELNKTIEFKINGKVENERNNNRLVPFYLHIKLENNNNF